MDDQKLIIEGPCRDYLDIGLKYCTSKPDDGRLPTIETITETYNRNKTGDLYYVNERDVDRVITRAREICQHLCETDPEFENAYTFDITDPLPFDQRIRKTMHDKLRVLLQVRDFPLEALMTKIQNVGFKKTTFNFIKKRTNVHYLGGLVRCSEDRFRHLYHIRQGYVDDIIQGLGAYNLKLLGNQGQAFVDRDFRFQDFAEKSGLTKHPIAWERRNGEWTATETSL